MERKNKKNLIPTVICRPTKMTFIDKSGNEFRTTPNSIKNGSWLPYEVGCVRKNPEFHMKQLDEMAKLKGGKIKEGKNILITEQK